MPGSSDTDISPLISPSSPRLASELRASMATPTSCNLSFDKELSPSRRASTIQDVYSGSLTGADGRGDAVVSLSKQLRSAETQLQQMRTELGQRDIRIGEYEKELGNARSELAPLKAQGSTSGRQTATEQADQQRALAFYRRKEAMQLEAIESLKATIESSQAAAAFARERADELERANEALRTEMESLREQLRLAIERAHALENEADTAYLEAARETVLAKSRAHPEALLPAEARALREQLARAEEARQVALERVQMLESRTETGTELRDENQTLREALEHQTRLRSELEEQLDHHARETEQLRVRLSETTTQLAARTGELSGLQSQLDIERRRADTATETCAQLEAKLNEYSCSVQHVQAPENPSLDLLAQLREAHEQASVARDETQAAQLRIQALEAVLAERDISDSRMAARLASALDTVKQEQQKSGTMEAEMLHAREALDQLRRQYDEFRTRAFHECSQAADRTHPLVAELTERLEKTEARAAELAQQLEEANAARQSECAELERRHAEALVEAAAPTVAALDSLALVAAEDTTLVSHELRAVTLVQQEQGALFALRRDCARVLDQWRCLAPVQGGVDPADLARRADEALRAAEAQAARALRAVEDEPVAEAVARLGGAAVAEAELERQLELDPEPIALDALDGEDALDVAVREAVVRAHLPLPLRVERGADGSYLLDRPLELVLDDGRVRVVTAGDDRQPMNCALEEYLVELFHPLRLVAEGATGVLQVSAPPAPRRRSPTVQAAPPPPPSPQRSVYQRVIGSPGARARFSG